MSSQHLCSTTSTQLFSASECEKIIELGKALQNESATVLSAKGSLLSRSQRRANVAWLLGDNPDATWLFERIASAIQEANQDLYHLALDEIEPLQFTTYPIGGVYHGHFDNGDPGVAHRKLTLSVQLSPPNTYLGGGLTVRRQSGPRKAPRTQGAALIFPTWLHHMAHPVYWGTRHCLVAWASGPPLQ